VIEVDERPTLSVLVFLAAFLAASFTPSRILLHFLYFDLHYTTVIFANGQV